MYNFSSFTIVVSLVFLGLGCSSEKKIEVKEDSRHETETPTPTQRESVGPFGLNGNGHLFANIQTTDGALHCELYEKRAPKTVRNFVELGMGKKDWKDPKTGQIMKSKPFYEGLIFHRIVPGFFLQTGDPLGTGEGGPGYVFDDEFHPELKHDRVGILSMANHGPNTNGSQFFILLKPAPHLNNHHSVFGFCEPENVIMKLASYPTDANDRPTEPPKIVSITFERKEKPALKDIKIQKINPIGNGAR